jgi:ribosome-binding factor A
MTRRIERVNHLIRTELSELLQRHIKDPRFNELLAVTEVITSHDLRHARIYVSCICTEKERQEILKMLVSASGYLRNELSRRITLRRIPDLDFEWDESIERGSRILDLIHKVNTYEPTEDRERHP